MDILIVSQYFWPEAFRINDLAQGLAERGHRITVLTGKPNYPDGKFFAGYHFFTKSREAYGQVDIIRSPLVPRGKTKWQLALNYLSFVIFASLTGLLKCQKPDVIFVYEPSPVTVGLPAILLKKIKKAPLIFWVQDLWPESVVAVGAARSPKIVKLLERVVHFIYQRCDYILTTSRAYFPSIKRYQIDEKKLHYFPQTCETIYQPLTHSASSPEHTLLPVGFRLIFSGNMGTAQDMETVLEAAKCLKDIKDIHFIFLGDGSKRCWLQNQIEQHQLSDTVHWLGQYPLERMPHFFACADALLVSLKSDPVFALTVPAKIQSYLACAKPIIAVLDGEGRRIIEEAKAGMTVQSGHAKALAETVIAMRALTEAARAQMGWNGRRYFECHFERDMLFQQLEDWMIELKGKQE